MDYITKDNIIIFSPYYNKKLDNELLTKFNQIIFSDYDLNENLFEAYNNKNFNNLNYIGSYFTAGTLLNDTIFLYNNTSLPY